MRGSSRKRLQALIIPAQAFSKARSLSVSYRVIFALAVLLALCIGALGLGVYHYGQMALRVEDYQEILVENDAYRSENHGYRVQTAQLGEKVDFLETTARKLMVVSGMDSEGLGGVGGFSRETVKSPPSDATASLESIDGYQQRTDELEGQLQRVSHELSERALIAAATPSILPVRGYVTGKMGYREDPFNGTRDYHTGIDVSAPYGSRVVAAADGFVLYAGRKAGYGNIVIIDHKFGMVTRYGHLWKIGVQTGQWISRSDILGYVGTTGRSTGPHLHFELWVHNRAVDPLKYIRRYGRSD